MLAQQKKSEWDVVKKPVQKNVNAGRGLSGNKTLSNAKIENLLEIIDLYKSKLITAEEEVINLKRQKELLEQDVIVRDKKIDNIQGSHDEGSSIKEEFNLVDKLKKNIRELELEKQRNKIMELAVKSLESKLKIYESKQFQIDSLKSQNRSLEEKIMRLTNLPSFNEVIDKGE